MSFLKNPIYKSKNNKKVSGVCSGIAKSMEIDASWVRIAFLLSLFVSGSGLIIYIVLALALDDES